MHTEGRSLLLLSHVYVYLDRFRCVLWPYMRVGARRCVRIDAIPGFTLQIVVVCRGTTTRGVAVGWC